ncbi:hypothetical protein VCHA57P526_20533 [Vibrio chagasii]|nr:hypothetical protein VCHA40O231_20079 [Vibrio chagasii]CAH7373603.1 hypothetical protein VCHA57P526_20533 [Vibrio chagasii]
MTAYLMEVTSYHFASEAKTYLDKINKFVLPNNEHEAIVELKEDLERIEYILKDFIQKHVSYRPSVAQSISMKLQNHLLAVKVWDSFHFTGESQIDTSGVNVEEYYTLKSTTDKFLRLTRSYTVSLAPAVLDGINTRNDELASVVHELNNSYNELNKKVNDSELKNIEMISSESQKVLASIKNFELDIKADLESTRDDTLSDFNTTFKQQSTKVESSINELKSKLTESISKESQTLDSKLNGLNDILEKEIRKEVSVFANQKDKITQVLGSLSEFRRAKSDIAHADEQKNEANKFRFYGVWMMLLPLFSFIVFFVEVTSGQNGTYLSFTFPSDLSGYLLRFLTIVLFSSPSVYLLKESAYHRKQELIYRNRGIQLSSIGAFLDDFEPEHRTKVKMDLVRTFYSSPDSKIDTSHVPDVMQQIKDVAALSKSLSKIVNPQASSANKSSSNDDEIAGNKTPK